jgi:predicted nucleic acid-binding protein
MLSIDTNILFHAYSQDSPNHPRAFKWIVAQSAREDVSISEFILAEFYGLLRNPAVLKFPLKANEAADVIAAYRNHPRWQLLGFPMESRVMHDALWAKARSPGFAFRRIYDVRSALTLLAQGVTEFATANVKGFERLGFQRVFNPLDEK